GGRIQPAALLFLKALQPEDHPGSQQVGRDGTDLRSNERQQGQTHAGEGQPGGRLLKGHEDDGEDGDEDAEDQEHPPAIDEGGGVAQLPGDVLVRGNVRVAGEPNVADHLAGDDQVGNGNEEPQEGPGRAVIELVLVQAAQVAVSAVEPEAEHQQ